MDNGLNGHVNLMININRIVLKINQIFGLYNVIKVLCTIVSIALGKLIEGV